MPAVAEVTFFAEHRLPVDSAAMPSTALAIGETCAIVRTPLPEVKRFRRGINKNVR